MDKIYSNNDNGASAYAVMLEDDKANDAARAEMEREEALKGKPPVEVLGRLPQAVSKLYSRETHEVYEFENDKLTVKKVRSMASPESWAKFLYPDIPYEKLDKSGNAILNDAIDWLIDQSRTVEPFNTLHVRGGGLWEDTIDGALGVVWNNGGGCYFLPYEGGEKRIMQKIDNYQGEHTYFAILGQLHPPAPAENPLSFADAEKMLSNIAARPWAGAYDAEIYMGAIVNGLLSGIFECRPNVYITGASMGGKSELRKDTRRAIGDLAFNLVGKKTSEPGVRRKMDNNAMLALNDEFVKDGTRKGKEAAAERMDTMRGSHDHEDGIVTLAGEGKRLQEYRLLNTFICYATVFPSDDPQDKSRFFELRLNPYADENEKLRVWEQQEEGRAAMMRRGFNAELLARVMWELPSIKDNIARLSKYLIENKVQSRRHAQLAHIMAGFHAVMRGGLMTDNDMEHALDVAREVGARESITDDSSQFINVLMGIRLDKKEQQNTRQLCATLFKLIDSGEKARGHHAQNVLNSYNLSLSKKFDCLLVKTPLHPEIIKELENFPQLAGGDLRKILSGAGKTHSKTVVWINDKANIGGYRCRAYCIPRDLLFTASAEDDEDDA